MSKLEEMSAKELLKLSKDALVIAEAKKDQEKRELRTSIIDSIRDAGYTLDEIFPRAAPLKPKSSGKAQAEPKYQHPDNPALTWSGKGRKPNWLVAEEAAGRALTAFLIKPE